jgi:hypothetical protein
MTLHTLQIQSQPDLGFNKLDQPLTGVTPVESWAFHLTLLCDQIDSFVKSFCLIVGQPVNKQRNLTFLALIIKWLPYSV